MFLFSLRTFPRDFLFLSVFTFALFIELPFNTVNGHGLKQAKKVLKHHYISSVKSICNRDTFYFWPLFITSSISKVSDATVLKNPRNQCNSFIYMRNPCIVASLKKKKNYSKNSYRHVYFLRLSPLLLLHTLSVSFF